MRCGDPVNKTGVLHPIRKLDYSAGPTKRVGRHLMVPFKGRCFEIGTDHIGYQLDRIILVAESFFLLVRRPRVLEGRVIERSA